MPSLTIYSFKRTNSRIFFIDWHFFFDKTSNHHHQEENKDKSLLGTLTETSETIQCLLIIFKKKISYKSAFWHYNFFRISFRTLKFFLYFHFFWHFVNIKWDFLKSIVETSSRQSVFYQILVDEKAWPWNDRFWL